VSPEKIRGRAPGGTGIVVPTLRIGIRLRRGSSGSGTMMTPTFLMVSTPSSDSGDSRPVRSSMPTLRISRAVAIPTPTLRVPSGIAGASALRSERVWALVSGLSMSKPSLAA
jgi:hypothetical protein